METHEFEVGQWVIGWHIDNPEFDSKAWKIQKIEDGRYVYPEGYPTYNTGVENIKPFDPYSYFSVGDTVKITAKRSSDSRTFNGMFKVIAQVNEHCIVIEDSGFGLHFDEVEKVIPNFKVGDIVVITEDRNGDPVGTITEILHRDGLCYQVKSMKNTDDYFYQNEGTLRHATTEEIEEYNRPKLPAINGYKGKDNGDTLKYGCAELNKSWFTKSANRSIKSMVLDSGVEINAEQIEKIRKYLG